MFHLCGPPTSLKRLKCWKEYNNLPYKYPSNGGLGIIQRNLYLPNCQPCRNCAGVTVLYKILNRLIDFPSGYIEERITPYQLRDFQRIFKPTFRPRTNEMLHSFSPTSTRHFNNLPISIRESTNIYVLRRKLLHSIFFIITNILNYITLYCILLFQAPLLFHLIVLITLTYSVCSLIQTLSYWNIVKL